MAMTPQQRSDAARKAAATKAANRANGIGPTPKAPRAPRAPRTTAAPAWVPGATPRPTSQGQRLVVLAALEDFYAVRMNEIGITQDARDAFERYQKIKALALGPTSSAAAQTEADSALRMAAITLVKLSF